MRVCSVSPRCFRGRAAPTDSRQRRRRRTLRARCRAEVSAKTSIHRRPQSNLHAWRRRRFEAHQQVVALPNFDDWGLSTTFAPVRDGVIVCLESCELGSLRVACIVLEADGVVHGSRSGLTTAKTFASGRPLSAISVRWIRSIGYVVGWTGIQCLSARSAIGTPALWPEGVSF